MYFVPLLVRMIKLPTITFPTEQAKRVFGVLSLILTFVILFNLFFKYRPLLLIGVFAAYFVLLLVRMIKLPSITFPTFEAKRIFMALSVILTMFIMVNLPGEYRFNFIVLILITFIMYFITSSVPQIKKFIADALGLCDEKKPVPKIPEHVLKDTGIKHCQLRGGYPKDVSYCKVFAKTSCSNGDGYSQPCADVIYENCLIPQPVESSDDCLRLAQLDCEGAMKECQTEREQCLLRLKDYPKTKETCKTCTGLERCVEMRQSQCQKQSECWDDFLEFLKKETGDQYAKVWHTLRSNNITTRQQLKESTAPMTKWPWFVGKQDSESHRNMQNTIMRLKKNV
jgi:hypothetical protein